MTALQTIQFVVLAITAVASIGGLASVLKSYASLAESVKDIQREVRDVDKRLSVVEVEHHHNHSNGVPVHPASGFNSGPVGG